MQRYIMIRLVQSIFTLIGVSIIVFSLARLSGNPLGRFAAGRSR